MDKEAHRETTLDHCFSLRRRIGSGAPVTEEELKGKCHGLFCSPDVITEDEGDMMKFEAHDVLNKLDFEEG